MAKRKGYAEGGKVTTGNDDFRGHVNFDAPPSRGRNFEGDIDPARISRPAAAPPPSGRKFGMENKYSPTTTPGFAKGGKVKFEGSKKDLAQDRKGAKKMGISQKAYENTARDKAQDKAGQRQMYGKRK